MLRATRLFSSSTGVEASKSFSKVNLFDKSKSKKGSGNDKTWKDTILKLNFSAKAKDETLIAALSPLQKDTLQELKGKIVKYHPDSLKKLHIAGSFRPHQYNELFSQPVTLVRSREDSVIESLLKNSLIESSNKNRLVLTGQKGVGKSTILAHFQALAVSQPSILIPFSFADALVNGSTNFKLNSESGLYDQNMLSRELLKKIKYLNSEILSKIQLGEDVVIFNESQRKISSVNAKSNLLQLVSVGARSDVNSTQVIIDLINQLQNQSTYPVYLTVDNFTAFLQHGMTKYRDASNKLIYFQKFTLIDMILSFVSAEKSFQKGAVVVATHGDHKWKSNHTLSVALSENPTESAKNHAYDKFTQFDREFASRLIKNGKLQELKVSKFDLDETKALVDNMFKFNLIFNEYSRNEEESALKGDYISKVAERKYFISGNGNAKRIMDSCVLFYT
ncbi:mitochondrial 37S ribosomal protein [Martiniozyma asiatica (nom. inval.)]|nr:mitochondrial 37S ribosomal protein [Martiniozyma asiatica]